MSNENNEVFEAEETPETVIVGEPGEPDDSGDAADDSMARLASTIAGVMAGAVNDASLPSGVFRDVAFIACAHALIASSNGNDFGKLVGLAATMAGQMTAAKEAMQRADESRLNGT